MRMRKVIIGLMMLVLVGNLTGNLSGQVTVLAGEEERKGADSAVAASEEAGNLVLDNRNLYNNMSCSYSKGYVPTVKDGYAVVVLPILCDKELKGNKLRVAAELGDASAMPFACKNYEKLVELSEHTVNDGKEKISAYLVEFPLELSKSRVNGNYPVVLHASGTDSQGNPVSADFTVNVVIADGKDPNAAEPVPEPEPAPEEPVVFTPKVLVKSYECVKFEDEDDGKDTEDRAFGDTDGNDDRVDETGNSGIAAGDKFRLTVKLWNTSASETLKNASVTITSPETGFTLLSPSDTIYIGKLGAGKTTAVSFEYRAGISVLPGQYDFGISFDYAYGKAVTATGTGKAKVSIRQKMNVQFDDLQIPEKVMVSDTVTASLQAMNLGKTAIYNVRAEIEADGLHPGGTIFIGNIEPGNAASASVQITISGLSEGDSSYGQTKGKVTYFYEDADGNEYTEEREISTAVVSPFSEIQEEPEDDPGQWWIIIGSIGAVLLAFVTVFVMRFLKRRKKYELAE